MDEINAILEIPKNTTTHHINTPFFNVSASAGNGTLVKNEELVQNISFRAECFEKI